MVSIHKDAYIYKNKTESYEPNTQKVEAGGSSIQGQPGHMKSVLKTKLKTTILYYILYNVSFHQVILQNTFLIFWIKVMDQQVKVLDPHDLRTKSLLKSYAQTSSIHTA